MKIAPEIAPETAIPHILTPETGPPKPEILNLGPPRNGKIAKLAKDLRSLLNQMLADGATSAVIIDEFAKRGISLNHENISNWRHGGYQDWIVEQQWCNGAHCFVDVL